MCLAAAAEEAAREFSLTARQTSRRPERPFGALQRLPLLPNSCLGALVSTPAQRCPVPDNCDTHNLNNKDSALDACMCRHSVLCASGITHRGDPPAGSIPKFQHISFRPQHHTTPHATPSPKKYLAAACSVDDTLLAKQAILLPPAA